MSIINSTAARFVKQSEQALCLVSLTETELNGTMPDPEIFSRFCRMFNINKSNNNLLVI
jgi:hypothetical protein